MPETAAGAQLGRQARGAALAEARSALDRWGWERDWRGPDPYDALNGRRVPQLRRGLLRRAAIQLVKRSPLDLRRPLGIDPRHNSATIAHVLSATCRDTTLPEPQRRTRIEWCVEVLDRLRLDHGGEASWGYHFDVETRFFPYSATTPNTIATAFAGLALLDAHEVIGGSGLLARAASAGRFFCTSVGLTETAEGAYFGYFPGDRTPIHNANLLACSLLARLAEHGCGDRFREAAGSGVAYALAHQRPDGSWPYAEDPRGDWVDNFHTGYVLDALRGCEAALGEEQDVRPAWLRGLDFYDRALFDPDGAPRFTVDSRYPIDGQCVAQGIETFSRASAAKPEALERAWSTFSYAIARMRRRDGAFLFQRRRLWANRTPHVRWVQAPMLAALTSLGAALEAGQSR